MSQLGLDYYEDNICYIEVNHLAYVNSCKNGEYCSISNSRGTCLKYKIDFIKALDEKCSSDFECDENLNCENEKCSIGSIPYEKKTNGETYYYCSKEYLPIISSTQYSAYDPSLSKQFTCKQNSKMNGYCYVSSEETRAFPDYSKICGEIALEKITNSYNVKTVKMNEIGEVKVKSFVEDERACESGFALLFYGNEELVSQGNSNMFKYCVNFKESKKIGNNCIIKYTLEGENEYVYNTQKIPNLYSNFAQILNEECDYLDIKIDNFKKYLNKMNEKKTECQAKARNYGDPFTCENDELREYLYFYKNPGDLIIYKDEEEVLNYLFKEAYPLYGNNEPEKSAGFSPFLNIKIIISLLILLSF